MADIKLFENKKIRSVWNESEQKWYFSVQDVIEALTDSVNVKDYIKKMRKRDAQLDSNWGTNCPLVEMIAADGKRRAIREELTDEWKAREVKERKEYAILTAEISKATFGLTTSRVSKSNGQLIMINEKCETNQTNMLYYKNKHEFIYEYR